jgi:hypothetical protein
MPVFRVISEDWINQLDMSHGGVQQAWLLLVSLLFFRSLCFLDNLQSLLQINPILNKHGETQAHTQQVTRNNNHVTRFLQCSHHTDERSYKTQSRCRY